MRNNALVLTPNTPLIHTSFTYSHLSNKRGGWNKRGGVAKELQNQ